MNLATRGLDVVMGSKAILKEVDFDLAQRRFIGIIGPNGSGKSTLLKTFFKVIPPARGRVLINNENIRSLSQNQCARLLAALPQHHGAADLDLTVEDLVFMGHYPHKRFLARDTAEEWAAVRGALADFGLTALGQRKLATLSGGERQLVMLARAVVQNTSCLLLDEPTNHLDLNHQLMILEALAGLGKRVVIVFHDLSLAGKYCDYLYLMKDGQVAYKGPPANILTRAIIKEVYGATVEVRPHPVTGHPVVML